MATIGTTNDWVGGPLEKIIHPVAYIAVTVVDLHDQSLLYNVNNVVGCAALSLLSR
jgi:hypothetical protein